MSGLLAQFKLVFSHPPLPRPPMQDQLQTLSPTLLLSTITDSPYVTHFMRHHPDRFNTLLILQTHLDIWVTRRLRRRPAFVSAVIQALCPTFLNSVTNSNASKALNELEYRDLTVLIAIVLRLTVAYLDPARPFAPPFPVSPLVADFPLFGNHLRLFLHEELEDWTSTHPLGRTAGQDSWLSAWTLADLWPINPRGGFQSPVARGHAFTLCSWHWCAVSFQHTDGSDEPCSKMEFGSVEALPMCSTVCSASRRLRPGPNTLPRD